METTIHSQLMCLYNKSIELIEEKLPLVLIYTQETENFDFNYIDEKGQVWLTGNYTNEKYCYLNDLPIETVIKVAEVIEKGKYVISTDDFDSLDKILKQKYFKDKEYYYKIIGSSENSLQVFILSIRTLDNIVERYSECLLKNIKHNKVEKGSEEEFNKYLDLIVNNIKTWNK